MAKIRIKSVKLTPFLGEYFRVMEQFDSTLSSVIDSTLGLRCRSFGYQITSTTYGYDTAYCLKSHCGVRGCCRQKWVFLTQFILKFSNERTSTRKKDVEGLSCGFEDVYVLYKRCIVKDAKENHKFTTETSCIATETTTKTLYNYGNFCRYYGNDSKNNQRKIMFVA